MGKRINEDELPILGMERNLEVFCRGFLNSINVAGSKPTPRL
jgi:hypothetical protein